MPGGNWNDQDSKGALSDASSPVSRRFISALASSSSLAGPALAGAEGPEVVVAERLREVTTNPSFASAGWEVGIGGGGGGVRSMLGRRDESDLIERVRSSGERCGESSVSGRRLLALVTARCTLALACG